ncbi:MAG: MBL fold metallo-hydrolase [Planctomycetota bacterium]|jgi:beta-lactamase superfamily II metal-dependent hydrolase|nr:MBL fold metallo-hydrolase [Planctomycetota bacterium]
MKHFPQIALAAFLFLSSNIFAQELEVYFIDVGQGDSTLLISPTGQTFLFDAGENGMGSSIVVPQLTALGISHLDYVSPSHYHSDHLGGLDEVWNAGIRATAALDRGNGGAPTTQSYNDYKNRYSSVRQTISPGHVVNLGGGVTLTCLVAEGQLMGGGSVNISGSSQWENSASIAWLVEYGDFDMFLGGDLTGGGNGTADVESSVGSICGDVDVYQVNHHCSRTSSNSTFISRITPEFAVIPCGHANPYGYPKQDVLDRMNKSTWTIPVWSVTDGVGTEGYVDAGGTIVLNTDGNTYTATMLDGTSFTAWCDEQAPTVPAAGDLVVAEFMRDPTKVSDTDGEWLELAGARESEAVSTDLVIVSDLGSNSFTIRAPFMLEAGDELLLASDGLPSRNGGTRPHMVWPSGRFSMSTTDTARLRRGSTTLDEVSWTTSWPGAYGKSAEREDLLGDSSSTNFSDGIRTYGLGDKGTPGATNDADTTPWSGGGNSSYITVTVPPSVGNPMSMIWYAPGEVGRLYQGWITLNTSPGITVGGTHIPANLDAGWDATHNQSGWSGLVPSNEFMMVSTTVPNNPSFRGMTIYGIFATYQDVIPSGYQVRTVATPVQMVIQ